MRPFRLAVLVLVLAAVLAPQAAAWPSVTGAGSCAFDGRLAGEHFVVHWTSDPACGSETAYEPQAGEVLAHAEAAYAAIVDSWGFPAPLADGTSGGDALLDIYLHNPEDAGGNPVDVLYGVALPTATSAGWVEIKPAEALKNYVVGAAVFHLASLAIWAPDAEWFNYGTYEWAGLRAFGWPTMDSMVEAPDVTLDCYGTECDEQRFRWSGAARWPFFQYLQDRFGSNAVKELYQLLAAGSVDGTDALQDYLATKSTTLSDVFNDFVGDLLAGRLSPLSLKDKLPATTATIETGAAAASLTPVKVAINHLAARFVEIVPGSATSELCHPATLTVTVDVPAGTSARPKWYYTGPGKTLASFSITGSIATYSSAWDTCTWKDGRRGIIALPNASTTANGKEFKVTATLSAINMSVVLSPDAPPAVPEPRPTVPTPDAAPLLSLHAPAVIRVRKSRTLSLHVYASHEGFVRLALDGRVLGTVAVRAGQNLFKLKLPRLKAPSRRVAERSRFSITALSESGMTGGTISRRLVFARR